MGLVSFRSMSMKRIVPLCRGSGQDRPLRKYIGDDPCCQRCAKKVPPVAKILAVLPRLDCECGATAAGVHLEFGELAETEA
jgi:hypothetical protein